MELHKYLLITIFFLIISSFGYIFARRVLNENKLIYIIPISICFGSSFFVILLHLFSCLFGVPKATYICLITIIVLTLLTLIKWKHQKSLELGLPKNLFFILSLFSSLFGLLYLVWLKNFDTYDPGLYQLIGLMTKLDTYPPKNQFGPEIYLVYHNGVALFASALKIFSRIETLETLPFIQTFFIFTFPVALSALAFSITGSFIQAILASIIGSFCANLKSLELFTLILPTNLHKFISKLDYNLFWMADSSFVSPTQKALLSPNLSVALPLSTFLFFLCTKEKLINNKYLIAILFVSSYLYFCYESFWLPTVAGIFLYNIALMIKGKWIKEQIIRSLFVILILAISPILVGGVFQNKNENITKLVTLDIKHYTFSFSKILDPTNPTLNKDDEIICNANGNTFYKIPILSRHFFIEFGLPLTLLPLIFWWFLIKKKNLMILSFLFGGLVAFIIPFLITYTILEIETHRFLIYSRFVFSILFGAFIGGLLEISFSSFFINLFYRLMLSILIISLVIPGIYWLLPIKHSFEYRATVLPTADKKAINWLSKNTKSGDIGIGPLDIPFKCFELISIGGVYGSGVHIQNIAQEETRTTALTTLNPCLLSELNIKWLYLNKNLDNYKHSLIPQDIKNLLSIVPKDTLNKYIKEKLLIERFKYEDKSELRLIYEVNPKLIKNFCKNKNYIWTIGRLQQGNFIPIKSNFKTTFETKQIALKALQKFKKSLNPKEAIWYGVEAIRI